MRITDEVVQKALETGRYIRRKSWREEIAVYRYNSELDLIEFGYYHDTKFHSLAEDSPDKYCISFDDLYADDWEVVGNV